MKTKEIERETFTAADVVLIIIKNEGQLVDDLEYPAEFINAYAMLQAFNIIKSESGKFVPATNFDAACKLGVQIFVERELQRSEATKIRKKKAKNISIAALTTAAVAVAGYFYKKQKGPEREKSSF